MRLRISKTKAPSEKFAGYLVDQARVITGPSSAFGKKGEGYIRLSYATACDKLEESLTRIEKATREFKKT